MLLFTLLPVQQSINIPFIWIILSVILLCCAIMSTWIFRKKLSGIRKDFSQTNQDLLIKQAQLVTDLRFCQQEKAQPEIV